METSSATNPLFFYIPILGTRPRLEIRGFSHKTFVSNGTAPETLVTFFVAMNYA